MAQENRPGIIADLTLVVLMSTAIGQSLYSSLFMTQKLSNTIFFAAIPMIFIIYYMFKNKRTSLISAIILVFLLATCLSNVLMGKGNSQKLFDYFDWLYSLFNDQYKAKSLNYTIITELIIIFLVTLLIFTFTVKFYNFYLISFLCIAIFFVQLQFKFFSSKVAYVMFIFSLLIYYFFNILRRRKKISNYEIGNKLKFLVFIIPVSIIVMFISFLFPVRQDRISSEWLDDKADKTVDSVIEFFEKRFSGKDMGPLEYFSLGETGFGTTDRLGGNIKLGDTHVMNVKSEYSNLYLKASSKDLYDGHRWTNYYNQYIPLGNDLNIYSKQISSDSNELILVDSLRTNKKVDIFKPAKAEIEYFDIRTKSIFIPPKINLLKLNKSLTLLYDVESMISADEMLKEGFKYTVNYNYLFLNSDEFKSSIQKSKKGYYNDEMIINILKRNPKSFGLKESQLPKRVEKNGIISYEGDLTSFNMLKRNFGIIYSKYTQIPESIPERVKQLAYKLTRDQNNNYDKAKAIESYLTQNYAYTLKPGKPPKKQDFVDYFLFDKKEGYCTYYATAMVVLLRSLDIPARFVEGYMLPPTSENGVYKVTSAQAHAWVEVYFEGFGWIPFEPTAPFAANMYSNRDVPVNISDNMQSNEYDEYMDMINQYRNDKPEPSEDTGNNLNTDTTLEDKSDSKISTFAIISIIIGVLLAAVCVLVIFQTYRHKRFVNAIMNSDPNNAILIAYYYILDILRYSKLTIKAGETPLEFGLRVERSLYFGGFLPITDYFISARYSKVNLPEEAKKDMLEFIDTLVRYTYKQLTKPQVIINKYILGKM